MVVPYAAPNQKTWKEEKTKTFQIKLEKFLESWTFYPQKMLALLHLRVTQNAKSFAIVILLFFIFLIPSAIFGQTGKNLSKFCQLFL